MQYPVKFVFPVGRTLLFILSLLGFCSAKSNAQISTFDTLKRVYYTDTANRSSAPDDSLRNAILNPAADSLSVTDSLAAAGDSSARARLERRLGIRISPDALPGKVYSEARDSAVMDMSTHFFYLYGNAKVNYEDLKLGAGRIVFQQDSNVVTASNPPDSAYVVNKNTFIQGSEKFTYDSLQFNFRTKRAIVRNARTSYGEGYVYSEQVKRNPDQSIYGYHSIYTTCSLDTPHYGIYARKIKVIPNKIIASGPANIVIEQVPTPLFLPFGIFPISQTQRSGFKLPTYTTEQQRGLGLINAGYYLYLNDYVDFLLQGNVYSKGSYSVSGLSNYSKRYRYNGAVLLSYAYNKTGEVYEPSASVTKDFLINWRHVTDAKAHPGVSFNASVNAASGTYYSNNSYNVDQILQNQLQSNISFSKNWINKPYNLTVSARHSQNTQTRRVEVRLPEASFYVSQFNPFHRKNAVGTHWYDKITASYSVNGVNEIVFYDSNFHLRSLALSDFSNGLHHSLPISASYTVLRFVNMSFNVNYNEYWLTRSSYRYFNTSNFTTDTLKANGFYAARDFDASVNFSTRIYGMRMFKGRKLMGIRHVLTPNAGLQYRPDYAKAPFNYYYRTRTDATGTPQYLSPFDGSVVGTPGLGQYGNFSGTVNFGLNNNLQIKVRPKNDSGGVGKNVTLIDALSFNGGYNLAADSQQWSVVTANFRTSILNIFNVSASAALDPYGVNFADGRRLSTLNYNLGRGLLRLTNAAAGLSFALKSGQFAGTTKPAGQAKPASAIPAGNETYNRLAQSGMLNDYIDFNVPWTVNLTYSFILSKVASRFSLRDSNTYQQNLILGGDVSLTSRLKVSIKTGYDFNTGKLAYSSIDLYRDLHCWEMHLQTIPFGERKSYSFTLNVKAAVLQDLKLLRRRDYRDAVN